MIDNSTGADGPSEAPVTPPGTPDGFERLWTPHRMVYISGERKPKHDDAGEECPFCRAVTLSDADGLIVRRGTLCYVLLNLFPYNCGHLLVCPIRHVSLYDQITTDEAAEMALLTQQAMRVLRGVYGCHGHNVGMNQGKVSGAGVAGHLHQHVVPRWGGDANFFPIIGQTKALPELLCDTQSRIASNWDTYCEA